MARPPPGPREKADRLLEAIAEPTLSISCDHMDIRTFVQLMANSLGRKVVVDDSVKGKVTVVSPRIRRRDAFPLFLSILESVGCSLIQEGELYRVVTVPGKGFPLGPVVGPDEPVGGEGLVTKVFLLHHIAAEDVRRALLETGTSTNPAALVAIRETNHLIVTAPVNTLRRIERLLRDIDQPGATRTAEVVRLHHADPEELAQQLNTALAENESRAEQLRSRLPSVGGDGRPFRRTGIVVACPQANSLILVGTAAQLETLKQLIAQMDIPPPPGRGRLNAIFLRYLSAEEAAKSLNALLGRPTAAEHGPTARTRAARIAIEPSVAKNALLVDATPADFEWVRQLVEQIDRAPDQVHIEVLVAEHTASDDLRLGVELIAAPVPAKAGATVIQSGSMLQLHAESLMHAIHNGIFPNGLSIGVAHGERVGPDGKMVTSYPAAINLDALRRTGRVRIRSETSLQTQDNREASIQVVDQIPILKSTIQGGSGTARDVIQNIERMDVGLKLKMTPHIIPEGQVQMSLNTSIEAVIDPGPATALFTPTIARREVVTTVTVPDTRTIVIAGLTREDRKETVKRVPFLGSIPLLGLLFRDTVENMEKTNILILVTPRIVRSAAAADGMLEDWKRRTGLSGAGN